jgi:hypothetical protein
MMRVAAGGGSVELIEVIRAHHQFHERLLCCDTVTGTQDGPMFAALCSWQQDHSETEEGRLSTVKEEIIVACLRIVAARLVAQNLQEQNAENKLWEALRAHEEAHHALKAKYKK